MDVYGRWRTVCAARSQWVPWHAIAYKCLAVKGSSRRIHVDTAEVGRERNGSASVSIASHAPSRHGTTPHLRWHATSA